MILAIAHFKREKLLTTVGSSGRVEALLRETIIIILSTSIIVYRYFQDANDNNWQKMIGTDSVRTIQEFREKR